jgi:hypothetical protein
LEFNPGIEKQHVIALGESLFGDDPAGDEEEMSFEEFINMIVHLRPENLATVRNK